MDTVNQAQDERETGREGGKILGGSGEIDLRGGKGGKILGGKGEKTDLR